jgi:DNA-binding NtrC family response regulator
MTEKIFVNLNPLSFLQTFIGLSLSLPENNKLDTTVNKIEQLGLSAACCFENAYRQEFNLTGAIDHDKCIEMLIEIKNKIGGNFSRTSSLPKTIHLINTRCPFGDAVKQSPELCKMTSSVLGGMTARNFGYAKVVLKRRIAVGDLNCDIQIFANPSDGVDYDGDEYHWEIDNDGYIKHSLKSENKIAENGWCILDNMEEKRPIPDIIAISQVMKDILKMAKRVANSSTSVLITGETGVGKEIIAKVIHALSQRWKRPFIGINCGAIPENLVESALFGHEKGSFTDAYQIHHGYFERAEGGTLFLDEIDSLSLSTQVKLLRVLQEKEFERVGGKQSISCDVRIISATNANLENLISIDRFRRDIYYRINVISLHIPPLRQRPEDILPLSKHILGNLGIKYDMKPILSSEAINQLYTYNWPGNVRELENILERSLFLSNNGEILEIAIPLGAAKDKSITSDYTNIKLRSIRKQAINAAELPVLEKILTESNGNVSKVAKYLGISTRAIYKKLNTLKINPATFRHKN